jgi:predicted O-methyltransferase YrrM
MDFDTVARALDGLPYTSVAKGKALYDLVLERRPKVILELGFAHGVSTCYFAAAAEELGDSRVTAVDREQSRDLNPSLETLVQRLGLERLVSAHRERSSYTWFLKKEIAAQSQGGRASCVPKYDLIFIDGPKDWTNDGCAFFLCDKLLVPGGTLLFDDYAWSYRGDELARGKHHGEGYVFQRMSEDEFREPQIKAVFDLLVMQHPSYGKFEIIDGEMAMASKVAGGPERSLRFHSRYSLKYRAISLARRALGRGRRPVSP